MGCMVYMWFVLWFCFAGMGVLPNFIVGGNVVSVVALMAPIRSFS